MSELPRRVRRHPTEADINARLDTIVAAVAQVREATGLYIEFGCPDDLRDELFAALRKIGANAGRCVAHVEDMHQRARSFDATLDAIDDLPEVEASDE